MSRRNLKLHQNFFFSKFFKNVKSLMHAKLKLFIRSFIKISVKNLIPLLTHWKSINCRVLLLQDVSSVVWWAAACPVVAAGRTSWPCVQDQRVSLQEWRVCPLECVLWRKWRLWGYVRWASFLHRWVRLLISLQMLLLRKYLQNYLKITFCTYYLHLQCSISVYSFLESNVLQKL